MTKTIYHGSVDIIKKPVFGAGKSKNDYGLGFYCTEDINLAKEWAVSKDKDGYVNIYEICEDNLKILYLNESKYTIIHWLTILLENRTFDTSNALALEAKDYLLKNFKVDYEKYDIIVGYRADDSYFSFAQDFINGTISARQLAASMKLGKLGLQYVIKSQKAFNALKYCGYEMALNKDWISKRIERDISARQQYFNYEKNRRQRGDVYITQILDEEIKANDSRLQ